MKKHRPIKSCNTCRKRRMRCDKLRPSCSRCTATGYPCTYSREPGECSQGRSGESVAAGPSKDRSGSQPGRSDGGAPPRQQPERDTGTFSAEGWGRSSYLGPNFWGNALDAEVSADPEGVGVPVSFIASDTGPEAVRGLSKVGQLSRRGRSVQHTVGSRCNACGNTYNLTCVLGFLPPEPACQKLVETFFVSIFPLMPLFDAPSFVREMVQFWENHENQNCTGRNAHPTLEHNPQFLPLYFAILFSASTSLSPEMMDDILPLERGVTIADLYMASRLAARLTGFPRKPSIYALISYVYAESQLSREEEFSDGPTFVDTAFRVALSMGLHRDSKTFSITNVENHIRGQVWWYIIHLDAMLASSSGIAPLFMDEVLATTNNLSDHRTFAGSLAPTQIDFRLLVASCRYQCTSEMRRIICGHLRGLLRNVDNIQHAAKQLDSLDRRICDAVVRLGVHHVAQDLPMDTDTKRSAPWEWSWTLESESHTPAELEFKSWSVLLLHLMLHKTHLSLYHPLFRSSDELREADVYTQAIQHSQAYLRVFLQICSHPAHENYRWIYPRIYQPLQALSILIAHLSADTHADAAIQSRGLIDAIMALYNRDEGVVGPDHNVGGRKLSSYGREAWIMLLRARYNALKHAGKDPHVLFPRIPFETQTCSCGIDFHNSPASSPEDRRSATPPVRAQQGAEGTAESSNPAKGLSPATPNFDWNEWDALVALPSTPLVW